MEVNVKANIEKLELEYPGIKNKLIAVSKTKPESMVMEAYEAGLRRFGENKVQELAQKHEALPKDIEWHMIGHLQRNKVKYIAPFVHLIHSVDSLKLLKEVNKEGKKNNRVIHCLLQMHIAQEDTKFGFDEQEMANLFTSDEVSLMKNIRISGLMGMATNTEDKEVVSQEFQGLKTLFDKYKNEITRDNIQFESLSMGMSGDFPIALEAGSTMVRIGSLVFGARNYH